MAPGLTYLVHNYQPICGMIIGTAMLVFTFSVNYGGTKVKVTELLKQTLYNNNERTEYLTAKFVAGISKFSLLFGLSLVLLAIYFLENIK
jgi:hypothetical protein